MEIVGFGANISGIDIPITYNQVDRVYDLPLSYGQTNTSSSNFGFNIPTIGYYGSNLTRTTDVDGWGTITTPAGTYDALRVVQQLTYVDTVALDTLGGGTSIPRPLETHYVWLAAGEGAPVLEITTQTVAGQEVTSAARWKGTPLPNAICDCYVPEYEPYAFPNPAKQTVSIWLGHVPEQPTTAQLFSMEGKLVRSVQLNQIMQDVSLEGVQAGIYVLRVNGFKPTRLMVTE